jgi:hypothetical protein
MQGYHAIPRPLHVFAAAPLHAALYCENQIQRARNVNVNSQGASDTTDHVARKASVSKLSRSRSRMRR